MNNEITMRKKRFVFRCILLSFYVVLDIALPFYPNGKFTGRAASALSGATPGYAIAGV
jgi:hypothetical protein